MKRIVGLSLLSVAAAVMMGGCPFQMTPSTAQVRVVHASPDAPAVDVCANGSALFEGAPFPSATSYASVAAGTYAIRVVPAGAGCDTQGVISASLTFAARSATTVMAVNTLDSIEPLVLTDDNSAPDAGQARVRFVHASPDAPAVDITLEDGTSLFDNVAFRGNGGYISVPAGTYTLQVRDDTGSTVVTTLDPITVTDGSVYTVFAVGLLGGEPALDVLITKDR